MCLQLEKGHKFGFPEISCQLVSTCGDHDVAIVVHQTDDEKHSDVSALMLLKMIVLDETDTCNVRDSSAKSL